MGKRQVAETQTWLTTVVTSELESNVILFTVHPHHSSLGAPSEQHFLFLRNFTKMQKIFGSIWERKIENGFAKKARVLDWVCQI